MLGLLFWSAAALAAPDILPVSEVHAGMRGIAKTVVSGSKIEEFGVEVLGVMKNKGAAGDLILVRTFGDVIDRTGGIAQGMSGSPVYIDGKLVGAIAYGWSLADHKIGMVTPIADMLKLWDLPDGGQSPALKTENAAVQGQDGTAQQLDTPLMAAGFGQPALSYLQEQLKPYHLIPYDIGGGDSGADGDSDSYHPVPLEPGSAVGVELIHGDLSLGALGTVTYVENGKVLAFGHPFLQKGNVGYFMTNARIFTTVNGLESPFKVGVTESPIGMINQDRGAGIAGRLAKYPSVVPLHIFVNDQDLHKTQRSDVMVVQDQDLAPILAATSVFDAINKASDRVGPGTARVSFEIDAKDMPGGVLKRENMFYSPANVAQTAIAELHEALTMLASNPFHPVDIMDMTVHVSTTQEQRTATILSVQARAATAKPGDTINLDVTLKPFRGDPIVRTVSYTIPGNQPPGPLLLEVRGGGMVPLAQLLLKNQGLDASILNPKKKTESFAGDIKDLVNRDRNNDIVVEMLDKNLGNLTGGLETGTVAQPKASNDIKPRQEKAEKQLPASESLIDDLLKAPDKGAKNYITTDYIIQGDTQAAIQVVKK
ncbi:peptidase s1 pa clan [Lucifera butyrica]|uniref:Peptidase s1 pa clan n=2 Tax=Lucifera butyrica TaxID=1351585 RepID=A0A498RD63_9FIRM|nr:peptidase s1 pa clan [Lucifera butyrica]